MSDETALAHFKRERAEQLAKDEETWAGINAGDRENDVVRTVSPADVPSNSPLAREAGSREALAEDHNVAVGAVRREEPTPVKAEKADESPAKSETPKAPPAKKAEKPAARRPAKARAKK